MKIPPFTLQGYEGLLDRLIELGYKLVPSHKKVMGKVVYLRHDVDIHLNYVERIATIEEERKSRSCWYIGTRLNYNPGEPCNQHTIAGLAKRGHKIGLHYTEATDGDQAWLEAIAETSVWSFTKHQPSVGGKDMFALFNGNPNSWGIEYISDSRMKWINDQLERLLTGEGPEQVILNTHPEHWLADGGYKNTYTAAAQRAHSSTTSYIINLMRG